MSAELKKRIFTSIALFVGIIFCILINQWIYIITITIVLCICFVEWRRINFKYFNKNNKKKTSNEYIFIQLAGLIYLIFVWYSAIQLGGFNFEQKIFFIFILSVCAFSDIGGYILGKTIGGKKLTKISPNKTIAGSLGSLIFSIFPIFLFNFQNFINFNFSLKNIIFCLIISLTCQIGDLTISYFKRLNKIKDTGNILPGHGGLLDRIDGIIFAIPIIYILKIMQIF